MKEGKLELLTNEEIKEFFNLEDQSKCEISPIKEYFMEDNTYTLCIRVSTVRTLLSRIVLSRFINGKL